MEEQNMDLFLNILPSAAVPLICSTATTLSQICNVYFALSQFPFHPGDPCQKC